MFGYRVRYLGPEDDENEDMCFAYRGPVQKKEDTDIKKPSIMTPKICERAVSPKVANSTTSQISHKKLPSTTNSVTPNANKTLNIKRA